jgi:hypothetical protein
MTYVPAPVPTVAPFTDTFEIVAPLRLITADTANELLLDCGVPDPGTEGAEIVELPLIGAWIHVPAAREVIAVAFAMPDDSAVPVVGVQPMLRFVAVAPIAVVTRPMRPVTSTAPPVIVNSVLVVF